MLRGGVYLRAMSALIRESHSLFVDEREGTMFQLAGEDAFRVLWHERSGQRDIQGQGRPNAPDTSIP